MVVKETTTHSIVSWLIKHYSLSVLNHGYHMKKIRRSNKHHRRSRSATGGVPFDGDIEGIPNVIVVDYKQHCHFHALFPSTEPQHIAQSLNSTWIDPAYMVIALPRKLAREIVRHYHLQSSI